MPSNNEIFHQFWKQYQWAESKDPEYRLYHDEHGNPICYTTEDLPGQYILITAAEFAMSDPKIRVKNGKIVPRSLNRFHRLIPGTESGTPCHVNDVTIVVDIQTAHTNWSLENDI